jgi:hypothetical protein
VEPLRLDRIEPRAFRGQLAGKNAHPALFLHPLVVLVDPVLDVVTGVPGVTSSFLCKDGCRLGWLKRVV